MFTLRDHYGENLIEIRRDPSSTTELRGIHSPNECHIRLCNRSCYFNQAAIYLRDFLNRHGYTDTRISRIDICYDFTKFDYGDYPDKFLQRYMTGKYAKINQAEIRAYGRDRWDSRVWSSVSWGSMRSQVSTKFYNKSKELREGKDKPYIRQAWFEAGIVDNPITCTKGDDKPDVWRIEFSIRSPRRGWYTINPDGNDNKYHSYPNNLDIYRDRESIWLIFLSLQEHYFNFRHYVKDRRKYDCDRKKLFNTDEQSEFYKLEHPATARQTREHSNKVLLNKLQLYLDSVYDGKKRTQIEAVINLLKNDTILEYTAYHFTKEELQRLRLMIGGHTYEQAERIISNLQQELIF